MSRIRTTAARMRLLGCDGLLNAAAGAAIESSDAANGFVWNQCEEEREVRESEPIPLFLRSVSSS